MRVPIERSRLARVLFWLLLLAILAVAPFATWHSAPTVDARTHIEMMGGIVDHGLPWVSNGPVQEFPDLQARWQVARGDRLWALYPPLFAYVSSPFFRLGGLVAVSQATFLWIAFLACGAFLLARRVVGSELHAVAATFLCILSTPIVATGMDMSPYIHAETFLVWGTYFALRGLDGDGSERASRVLAGVSCGLAIESHLLSFPMTFGLMLALALQPTTPVIDPAAPEVVRWAALARAGLPTRASLLRALTTFVALAITLVPLALLNHVKFGSYNPISYGPCVWQSCAETGVDQQTLGIMLRYALPPGFWLVLTVCGLWLARRDKLALAVVAFVSFAYFVSSDTLPAHLWSIVKVGFGYLVDINPLYVREFVRPRDHVGVLNGTLLVRSVLQQTPIVVLVLFARAHDPRAAHRLFILILPPAALLGTCALRANEPLAYALGFPFIFLRYTVPGLAMLVVAAVGAVRQLPWRRRHVVAAVGIALASIAALHGDTDGPLWRRLFLLYAPLAAAIASVVSLRRGRSESAAWAVALAAAIGIGGTIGETTLGERRLRIANDARLDNVAAELPNRVAIVGWAPEIDTVLSLRATRDVQYLDLYETDPALGWTHFRTLVDRWTDEGRPIYALWPRDIPIDSPWPEVAFEDVLPSEHLVRVRKIEAR